MARLVVWPIQDVVDALEARVNAFLPPDLPIRRAVKCGIMVAVAVVLALLLITMSIIAASAAGPEGLTVASANQAPYIEVHQGKTEGLSDDYTMTVIQWNVDPLEMVQITVCETKLDSFGVFRVRCPSSMRLEGYSTYQRLKWAYTIDANRWPHWKFAIALLSDGRLIISEPALMNVQVPEGPFPPSYMFELFQTKPTRLATATGLRWNVGNGPKLVAYRLLYTEPNDWMPFGIDEAGGMTVYDGFEELSQEGWVAESTRSAPFWGLAVGLFKDGRLAVSRPVLFTD